MPEDSGGKGRKKRRSTNYATSNVILEINFFTQTMLIYIIDIYLNVLEAVDPLQQPQATTQPS